MQPARQSLIAELEVAVSENSIEERTSTLRRVTDLFLCDADRLSEDQIKVFDDVLCLLIRRIEKKALVELSKRLAPVDNSPIEAIRLLAHDESIEVAGPVLANSRRLYLGDLIEIAATGSQAHMLAIAGRVELGEAVTDVLLSRGDDDVVFKLATNPTARFSKTGYGILVRDAENNDGLAETVGLRLDLPPELLRELLQRATDTVRTRIFALAPPESRDEIQRVIIDTACSISKTLSVERDFSRAEEVVRALEDTGRLTEAVLLDFISRRRYEEMTVALARLAGAPLKMISGMLIGLRNDAVLLPCKAAYLSWPTAEAILRNRHSNHTISQHVIDLAQRDYERLSVATAQRTLRFMQIREVAK